MITLPSTADIFLYSHPTDMRKSFCGLSGIVRSELGREPNDGSLFLLSVGDDTNGVTNASYERVFGKLIGLQDHFAHVIADTTNRRIKNVVQGVASAVFFPI